MTRSITLEQGRPLRHGRRRPRAFAAAGLGLALGVPLAVAPVATPGAAAATAAGAGTHSGATTTVARAAARQIAYRGFDTGAQLKSGTATGVLVRQGRLHLAPPAAPSTGPTSGQSSGRAPTTSTRLVGSTRYEQGTWDSPWVTPGFSFTELIPSWSARTPGNSFIEIRLRGRDASGRLSSWDVVARWAATDRYLRRTSFGTQPDDLASLAVDTWRASAGLAAYQVRVTLARRAGGSAAPTLDSVGAVASRLPTTAGPTSKPGSARGTVLDVPRYSQMIHRGHYPAWDGGGEAWCSPTSTSMVLGYYDRLPAAREYAWVPAGHVDPWVDFAARSTYDVAYQGAGNWPFNVAYAAPRIGHGYVTRLRSLREAEPFLLAGVPLVASLAFARGQLTGAPISSTAGHVLVIVGLTATGDVVVNDPASTSRAGVRRTYDRAEFERAWLEGSGGTVYVLQRR
ncbi:C39 family peptidase [Nocardioides sp. R-C-SC26]|uniref:C39 family peptidase n=1 Tax=Nocardioides sp. R-C-SC26 TaxID=2870414 RepID=UPI001E64BA4F|nr:C39 family peptidase [Nocardioides sp. R-C-SC26]